MRSIRRSLAVAAAASLALGSCASDDGPDATDTTDTATSDDGTDGDDTTDAGDADAGGADGGGAPEGTVEVTDASLTDEEANVTVEITSIEVQDAAVIVTAEAANRGGERRFVIGGHEMVKLFDDAGGSYTWVPPEDEPSVLLEAGDEASFVWAFRGAPSSEATSFLLTLNHWPGPDGDPMGGGGMVPFKFEDLPVPGASS